MNIQSTFLWGLEVSYLILTLQGKDPFNPYFTDDKKLNPCFIDEENEM